MPFYHDIYAIAPRRDPALIGRFLDLCLPRREETAQSYRVPQYSSTSAPGFDNAEELIPFMILHPEHAQAIYWKSLGDGDPAHAMLFFVPRGSLIFGVSISAHEPIGAHAGDAEAIASWLSLFARELGARHGYSLFETPPAYDSARAFLRNLRKARLPKLVRGALLPVAEELVLEEVVEGYGS